MLKGTYKNKIPLYFRNRFLTQTKYDIWPTYHIQDELQIDRARKEINMVDTVD